MNTLLNENVVKFSPGVKDHIFDMLNFMETVRREVHAEVPPQQMVILFFVALNQGITQAELAKQLSMPEGTVSRNLAKLSSKLKRGKDGGAEMFGYGLIETRQDDLDDSRKKLVYVTEKGARIIEILEKKLYHA